ncbi:hypothetical protein ACJ41P_10650 [Azospirillum argentinense]|uniref:Putative tail fiber protein gp53-like C-terminal domain-containing protein n=1 Tax=Azospirillum argentinense TaxID=2970906 RepID=A0ABW8V8N7_9PROT
MLFDRVEQTTTTTGTGTLSLIAPSDASRRSFVQGAGSGNQAFYCIETTDGLSYEYGYGTVTAGTPDTLTRNVLVSSNSNSLVNFPSGTKRVFCCLPASSSGFGTTRLTSTWGGSIGASGWKRDPNGLIMQWATILTGTGGNANWTYPIAFPNRIFIAIGFTVSGAATTSGGSTATLTYAPMISGSSNQYMNCLALGD